MNQVQANMPKAQKNRASKQSYVSPKQLILNGFETPFSRKLNPNNRWVILAHKIPWDTLVGVYQSQMNNEAYGAEGINPRVAIGAIIIKHMCNLSDRETIQQVQENMYMQYFIGYSSFSDEEPFDPSLFVDLRKRLGIEQINLINEKIMLLASEEKKQADNQGDKKAPEIKKDEPSVDDDKAQKEAPTAVVNCVTNKGQLIVDATAAPQDISYPTDLNLLNDAREKSEELIDLLYNQTVHKKKPRTYREVARKFYLRTAQKKSKTKKEIRKAIRSQLGFLKRNINNIHKLLDVSGSIHLKDSQYKYLLVIQTLYDQQYQMFREQTHSIEHRIVSIHQPHVRPIVRGKTNAYVEFGAKLQVSLMNGIGFLEEFSWEAFNEGSRLMTTVEEYKRRFGCYPAEVLADKIYCNKDNRLKLKLVGIRLKAKPLGRPKAVEAIHVSPGERNPIEGLFGQAKTAYGLNRVKARLAQTSESWIASIILVLNLVKLTGQVPLSFIRSIITYSARWSNFWKYFYLPQMPISLFGGNQLTFT
jgi:IS5 family transposase